MRPLADLIELRALCSRDRENRYSTAIETVTLTPLLSDAILAAIEENDRMRAALEQIKQLKSEPIGDTGFSVGPLSLLHAAQRIAREATSRKKRSGNAS